MRSAAILSGTVGRPMAIYRSMQGDRSGARGGAGAAELDPATARQVAYGGAGVVGPYPAARLPGLAAVAVPYAAWRGFGRCPATQARMDPVRRQAGGALVMGLEDAFLN